MAEANIAVEEEVIKIFPVWVADGDCIGIQITNPNGKFVKICSIIAHNHC